MGYFARSLDLAKRSWAVLRKDKELLLLPLWGMVGVLIIMGAAFGLVFLIDYDPASPESFQVSGASIFLMILGSLLSTIAVYFFQGALVHGAWERLNGGDPTVKSALRGASHRLGKIVRWSLLTFIVGTIINIIQSAVRERAGILGDILGSLLGLAWRVLTFLVMPIVIVEGTGAFASVKRSKTLLKSTWGENLAAQAGFFLVGLIAALPGLLLGFLFGSLGAPIIGVIIGLLFAFAGSLFISAMSGVYQTALYQFTTTHRVPDDFVGSGLETAFSQRQRGLGTRGF